MSADGDGQNSEKGVGIGLTVVLVFLLAGNLRALVQISAQLPSLYSPRQGQPVSPAAAAAPRFKLVPPPSPKPAEQMEFTKLTLEDLVLGLLDLDSQGPDSLRLTPEQKASLRALEPRIAARFKSNDRAPGTLDEDVRKRLTVPQMAHMLETFQKRERPPSLAPYVPQLHRLLAP